MYDDVLVPTDGNQRMSRVIEEAIDLADRCGATVHAINDDRRARVRADPRGRPRLGQGTVARGRRGRDPKRRRRGP